MRIRALRGVCIGVDRHLVAGERADLDTATVQFLISIGAAEASADDAELKPDPSPEKPAKKEK